MWGTTLDVDIDGDSSQNIVGNQVSGDVIQSMNTFVRGRPSMYLGSAEIADRVNCYVPGRNHDLVVKALEVNHTVVLVGPRGCGRETTAIVAIRQLRPDIPIRRFSLEDEDAEEIGAKVGCGYLIHAADGGLPRLGRCIDAVQATSGYLAVVADPGIQLHPAIAPLPCVIVEPPCPLHVYQLRMTTHGFTEWSHWQQASELLENALPTDARRLAYLIEQVNRQGGDIAAQQAEVTNAHRGWKTELRGWFDNHPAPHERALLIAAATLPLAAEKAYVYSAASSLAQRLQITVNGSGLAWCPATGLAALLEAEQEDNRIVFRRQGFAESALRHALADYPLARPDLLAWLAALPTDQAVRDDLRNSLAETLSDLAAEHGEAELITRTGRTWGDNNLADLTFIALSRTCLHPRVGTSVRSALYEWSRAARTPQTLKLAIARVCEPLGQTYPQVALTRLKHLATHGNRQVRDEVMKAARALAASGQRAEVFMAALAWCAKSNEENLTPQDRKRRRRVGVLLFLELARPVNDLGLPEVLGDDQAVEPMTCLPGWQAALAFHTATYGIEDDAIEDVLWRWLDAALLHARLRERIIEVFIQAATSSLAVPPNSSRQAGSVTPHPTAAEIMIGMVQRWASQDPTNFTRQEIKEDIVIPLTQPRWLQLLKELYIYLRTLVRQARTR